MAAYGVDRLIAVTQMKSSNANEDAAHGADKQRNLIAQQRAVRSAQSKLDDATRDGKWTDGDYNKMNEAIGGLNQAGVSGVAMTGTYYAGNSDNNKIDSTGSDPQKYNARVTDDLRKSLENAAKDLEAQDRLGNFEIQDLMSQYNQAETLASSVLKKKDDTSNAIIGKVG